MTFLFDIIVTEQVRDGYEAGVIGSPSAKGVGTTPEASVGDLVAKYPAVVASAVIIRLSNPQLEIQESSRAKVESAVAKMLQSGRQPTMVDLLSLAF